MSPDTRLGLSLLMICAVDFCAPEDTRVVPARSGEDVSLQCRGPTDASITRIEWIRTDPKSDKYVFFYREKRPYKRYQLPSFHGRVELEDGDASVTVKNVTVNDSGTYECWIMTGEKDAPERISIIKLRVRDGGDEDGGEEEGGDEEGGHLHEHLGLLAAALLLSLIFCGCVIWKCQRSMKKNSEPACCC